MEHVKLCVYICIILFVEIWTIILVKNTLWNMQNCVGGGKLYAFTASLFLTQWSSLRYQIAQKRFLDKMYISDFLFLESLLFAQG